FLKRIGSATDLLPKFRRDLGRQVRLGPLPPCGTRLQFPEPAQAAATASPRTLLRRFRPFWFSARPCRKPEWPRTLHGGSIHSEGLPAPGRRPGERRPSFTRGIGEKLARLRLEDGDERAVGNVLAVLG